VQLRDVTDEKSIGRDARTLQTLVAHKFRTPLSGLIGSLHILADESLGAKERTEFARTAIQSAERLASQLERILMAVRKRSAAEPPCPMSVVPVVVREIALDLGLVKVPGVVLEPSTGWRKLRLGSRSLEWILRELFENSVKFHPSNTPEIEVGVQMTGPSEVTLSVSDDGIHLSPEQLVLATRPYAQGEKFETGETPGMGLGLAVVVARLWEAGGSLSLRNRREKPGVVAEVVIPTDDRPGA
jgi:two-component system sensor histidine kinase TorS